VEALDVAGVAQVFEAALTVELRDAQGAVVRQSQVTAAEAGPTQTRWQTSFDLAAIPTGAYEIVAYSLSAENGSPVNVFAIPIRIST